MIYRFLPYILMYVARRLTKSRKVSRASQTRARRTARRGR